MNLNKQQKEYLSATYESMKQKFSAECDRMNG